MIPWLACDGINSYITTGEFASTYIQKVMRKRRQINQQTFAVRFPPMQSHITGTQLQNIRT